MQSDHLHSTHAATLDMQCPQPQLRCLLVLDQHRGPRVTGAAARTEIKAGVQVKRGQHQQF